jgi:hypothetical protein
MCPIPYCVGFLFRMQMINLLRFLIYIDSVGKGLFPFTVTR